MSCDKSIATDVKVPQVAKEPPDTIVGVDGIEFSVSDLPSGRGKYSFVYSYFKPCELLDGKVKKIECTLCSAVYAISKNSLSGPVAHLRTDHLIF